MGGANGSGERRRGLAALEPLSRWPATTLVAAAVLALSVIRVPAEPPVPLFPHADKLAHWIEYFVLGALLFRSLRHDLSGHHGLAVIMALSSGALFGIGTEWLQGLVGRTPDAWDAAADVAGLVSGVVCVLVMSGRRGDRGG